MRTLVNKVTITIDGEEYKNYTFLNIVLHQQLLRPNELSFTMQNKEEMELSDHSSFTTPKKLMGAKVNCRIETLRFDDKDIIENEPEVIEFKGIIFNVNVYNRSDMFSEQLIDVTAFSPDYLLADHPHCFSYEGMTLEAIVKQTLSPHDIKNIIKPRITEPIPYTVQYNESNYQFLARLAQRYGEWMYNDGEKWIFGNIETVKKEAVLLLAKNDIRNYHYRSNLMHHKVNHAHHDYLEYKNLMKSHSDVKELTASGYDLLTDEAKEQSNKWFKKETFKHLRCSNPEGEGANAIDDLQTSIDVKLYGEKTQQVVCNGSTVRSDLTIGSCIQILDCHEVAEACSMYGDLMITGIIHRTEENGEYSNDFTAVPSKCEYPPYHQSDLFPGSSSQRAKVMDNKDPEKMGRIRVQFLWQEEQDKNLMTPWIRIAQPHGGDGKGFYFIPEIDEEVMVDFENGNAEKPYVVGTLYHGKQKPKSNHVFDDNKLKSIRTRNGHTISFVDEGTGGRMGIFDSEKDTGEIRSYFIGLDSDKKLIKIISRGNIELYASNNIIMNAGGNIESYAGRDITEQAGNDIRENASNDIVTSASNDSFQMAFGSTYVKGESSVEIQSGGDIALGAATKITTYATPQINLEATAMVEIKAPIVKIN